ncbi:hypothetical protein ACWGOE_02850 [Leucobacter chromiiresistens]
MGETDRSESEHRDTAAHERARGAVGAEAEADGLVSRIELIESQPLPQRAAQFEQLHDELLAELQRGDHGGA